MNNDRSITIVGILVSAVLAISVFTTHTATGGTAPVSVNVTDPGPGTTDIGIRFDPIDTATAAASVSQDQAVAAATSWLALPDNVQAAARIETRLVRFTNENWYSQDAAGIKHYQLWQVPAWVVSTSGIDIPSRGGLPGRNNQVSYNHEMNVVIDARTGQYLQAFTYR